MGSGRDKWLSFSLHREISKHSFDGLQNIQVGRKGESGKIRREQCHRCRTDALPPDGEQNIRAVIMYMKFIPFEYATEQFFILY